MNKFLATLDRLSSEFADDLVQAVRHASSDELYRLLGRDKPAPVPPPAPAPIVVAKPPVVAAKPPVVRNPYVIRRPAAATPAPKTVAAAAAPPVAKPAPAPKPAKLAALTAYAEQQVRRFFEDSGRRGATAQQVQRHLEHDESDPRVSQLLVTLAREGLIKDAGFRRTTGNGTQPVFVVVPRL